VEDDDVEEENVFIDVLHEGDKTNLKILLIFILM